MKTRWHILREGDAVTLCRHQPPRFDFVVRSVLPHGRPERLAHQIRQDLWRALRTLRGFSPVVRLERCAEGWAVWAGGRAARPVSPKAVSRAQEVLENRDNRIRWTCKAGGSPT